MIQESVNDPSIHNLIAFSHSQQQFGYEQQRHNEVMGHMPPSGSEVMSHIASASDGPSKKRRLSQVGVVAASAPSSVNMRTVLRWRGKDGINVDHVLGANEAATIEERARAEQVLANTGQLICILCAAAVAGNKKSIRRHQHKNKTHTLRLAELVSGMPFPSTEAAMNTQVPLPYIPTGLIPGQNTSTSQGIAEAWEIVKNPGKCTDFDSLTRILESLGCYDAKDLSYCKTEEIESMAIYLKKVPQRNFYKVFNIDK